MVINQSKIKLISIKRSNRTDKKYVATFNKYGGTILIHFGAKGYEDYTTHKNDIRKAMYLVRHRVGENWDNPLSAGSLSRYILWNLPTLEESVKDFKKRFNV